MTDRTDDSEVSRIIKSERGMKLKEVIEEMKRQGRELDKNKKQNNEEE